MNAYFGELSPFNMVALIALLVPHTQCGYIFLIVNPECFPWNVLTHRTHDNITTKGCKTNWRQAIVEGFTRWLSLAYCLQCSNHILLPQDKYEKGRGKDEG